MTKSKQTKSALFSSVVALLLCFTMLLGTTFAWFTDSVSSSGNKIQAGTLKIDLELLENGTYTSVRDMTAPIFNYDLWEPGYTEVKTLKIVNEGNLALKYQLNVIAENADCILANVIDVYMCFGESTATSAADLSDTSKWWKCGTLAEMMANPAGFTQGKLLPTGSTYDGELLGQDGVAIGDITASIALHMQETAGNEYQGLDLGNIDINLLATQFTYEKDSFDDQYDKEAEDLVIVNSFKDMMKVCQTGGTMILGSDLVYTAEDAEAFGGRDIFTIENESVTLDMNGHSITVADDASNLDGAVFFVSGSEGHISIVGNGAITVENGQAVVVWVKTGATADVYGGTFTSNAAAHEAMFYSQGNGGVINIYGGQYIYDLSGTINGGFNVSDNAGTELRIVLHEGVLLNHAEYSQHLQGTANGEQERIQLAEGCSIQEVVIDGTTWYKVVCD